MSEAGPGRHIPEFAVTLRGYDRGQVEEYVSALQTFLAVAQRRAAAAEAELAEVRAARSVGGNVGGRAKEALRLDEPASAPERPPIWTRAIPCWRGFRTGSAPASPASSPRRSRLPASFLTRLRRSQPDRWPLLRAGYGN